MMEEIIRNIYLISGNKKGRFPFANSILILGKDNEGTLIDTGCGIENLRIIKKNYRIVTIINSHTHPDHSAGNWVFECQVKKIYVPKEGFRTAGNIIALSERYAAPGPLAATWRTYVKRNMHFKEFRPTHAFDEKTNFEFGSVSLIPVYTPGHSLDHYCFYEPSQKIMFTFDIDFSSFGPWYGHRESSIADFKRSLLKLKEFEIKTIVSGHKDIIKNNIQERIDKYGNKFLEREQKIRNLLKKTRRIEDLVEMAPIYGTFPYAERLLRFWEEQMLRKHLEEMGESTIHA